MSFQSICYYPHFSNTISETRVFSLEILNEKATVCLPSQLHFHFECLQNGGLKPEVLLIRTRNIGYRVIIDGFHICPIKMAYQ